MCKESDFTANGFDINDENRDSFMSRFCPDFDAIKDYWRIKNGYTNQTERLSFSIEILKCNEDNYHGTCASDPDIDVVLKNIYFTMYYL